MLSVGETWLNEQLFQRLNMEEVKNYEQPIQFVTGFAGTLSLGGGVFDLVSRSNAVAGILTGDGI